MIRSRKQKEVFSNMQFLQEPLDLIAEKSFMFLTAENAVCGSA